MKDITRYVSDEILDKVIADLRGTFKTLGKVLDDYGIDEEDLTAADYQYIWEDIFLCPWCGWWCDVSEAVNVDGVLICQDCA